MPVRGAVTRRSLDTNAPERKSGRAAFKSARSMFEHQHPQEHGDEQYGNTVYSASIGSLPDEDRTTDDSSNTKSINDLIKNFEALSTPHNRGRSFGSARVTRSASPVKWKRKSGPAAATFDDADEVPTIPAEPPRSARRGRPSAEYAEMDTETTLNYSRITELDYTMDKPVTDSGTFSDPTLNSTDLNSSSSPVRKRTDMNRLADPTLPHSFITGIPPESSTDIPETRRLLSWSEKPIMVGETHDREDYERGNPDLDPVAESAVYELEKRLDKMSKFDLELVKDSNGYGLSIIGMGIGADSGVERLGIYVKKVFPGQAAEKVGIEMADQIVEVDGISLVGVSHSFAADTLRSTSQRVRFLMARDKDKDTSEVRQLILNTLENEQAPISSAEQSSDDEGLQNGTFDGGHYDSDGDSPNNTRVMQDAQNRLLHELRLKDNEIANLKEELERYIRKNRQLEEDNRQLEELVAENMHNNANKTNPRSWNSTLESTLDGLDDLEESRVDDTLLSQWTAEDVSNWLNNNHLETLIPLFRLHKIDGKELDRIREKNDSKMLKQLGIQKEQRAQLRTALRSLASAC